jgi:hypothetical protein
MQRRKLLSRARYSSADWSSQTRRMSSPPATLLPQSTLTTVRIVNDFTYDLLLLCGKSWWKVYRGKLREKCRYFAKLLPPVDPVCSTHQPSPFDATNLRLLMKVNPRMVKGVHDLDPEYLDYVIKYLESQGM